MRALKTPAAQAPAARLTLLQALLDICLRSYETACLAHTPDYLATAKTLEAELGGSQRDLYSLRVQFYRDAALYRAGDAKVQRLVLEAPGWKAESLEDLPLYLRRQVLRADVQMALDDYAGADRTLGKLLSLLASLENPEQSRFDVACVLAEAIASLTELGQTERAYGLHVAAGRFIEAALPERSVEAAVFRLTEARLLEELGDAQAAQAALDDALAKLAKLELGQEARERLVGRALTLKAVTCFVRGDSACAQGALEIHPYRARFAEGRAPNADDEVAYLAARALVAAGAGQGDPAVVRALEAPLAFESRRVTEVTEVYRTAGRALALPPGEARAAALLDIGPRMATLAKRSPTGGFGAWYRPGLVDQTLIALALGRHDAARPQADADAAFSLLQLAGRTGASFDADALTVLAQARDPLERRSIHQALRLKARRDKLEREGVGKVAARAFTAAPKAGTSLRHDGARRAVLRDFNLQIDEAGAALAKAGVTASGANLVELDRFQAVLREGEAALVVAPLAGDVMAYMCIRRDQTQRSVRKADLRQAGVDAKIIQAGLSAGHAPSEALDAQFPVAAAMRLYDVLIRPFGDCVRPGDHIIWLPKLAAFATPLAVLLETAPPKVAGGHDLAQADWLGRSHAVSYPGSASVIVAARANRMAGAGDFDFLGVGDPILGGKTAGGEDRGAMLLRGVRGAGLSVLTPLPETKLELEQSSRGFRNPRVLLGGAATERGFRGELIGAYRYLSFATHGLLRDDIEGLAEPALVLTPVSSANAADDGLLTASEIADFNLVARFVALSACNTANFDLTQFSQELPALASAFAVAGVPATLATLWPVNSQTSQQVVAAAFEALRGTAELGPAQALAHAQRAFLTAPPGKAYLHPRFWAPFVVLGDGGAPPPAAVEGVHIASTQILTRGGGDAVALDLSGERLAARLMAEPGSAGRPVSAVQVLGGERAGWRQDNAEVAVSRPILQLGSRLLAGGYRKAPGGDFAAVVEAFDEKSGRRLFTWQAPTSAGVSAIPGHGLRTGPDRALFTVTELAGQGRDAGRKVRVFEVGAEGEPRELFATDVPPAAAILETTLSMVEGDILLTYSARGGGRGAAAGGDDYDLAPCTFRPATVVERRDARTGRLLALKALDGYVVTSAGRRADGSVLLAGSFTDGCASQARAFAGVVDKALAVGEAYRDRSLGFSEVRAVAAAADGGVLLAIMKANVLDYAVGERAARLGDFSTALVVVTAAGEAWPAKMLDAGSGVLISAASAGRPGDLVLGGALGGEAVIVRLKLAATKPAAGYRSPAP